MPETITSHTPGPWEKVRGSLVGANGQQVVEYGSGLGIMCGGGADPEHVANARLITAAPDLLGELERMADNMAFILNHAELGKWTDKFMDELADAREVIAKATGEATNAN